jgi:APA family basic amino acid/polyamine antiporter
VLVSPYALRARCSPYSQLDDDAPLTMAFASFPHTEWIRVAVDVGAVVGLSTCLLIGLYSQSRIYLAIARDGLLPAALTIVAEKGGSPYVAQIFCGGLAALLATFFDVDKLSEILSIGKSMQCQWKLKPDQ